MLRRGGDAEKGKQKQKSIFLFNVLAETQRRSERKEKQNNIFLFNVLAETLRRGGDAEAQ